MLSSYVSVPAIVLVLLVVGGLTVGAIISYLAAPNRKRVALLEAELARARSEHRSYRERVTDHFRTTSDLVANMTASYKAVYDHLAQGARSLSDGQSTIEREKFGVPILTDPTLDIGPPSEPQPRADDPASSGEGRPVDEPVDDLRR